MSAPKPPVALRDHCSVIHDGVLYVYSPEAFQTLELKDGGEWKEEQNGEAVVGAVCVKGGVDGDNSRPALYVVGGAANDSASDFPGLQRFSIQDKRWDTITPSVRVTQHRQNHGAAYMNASSSLIVYGGSQDGNQGLSSETFVVQTYPPYNVLAYNSQAPPTSEPFMMPWSEDRALMVGGSDLNFNVFTFNPVDGWQDVGVGLPNPLPNQSVAQCALYTLPDQSRILQTYQLDQSPAVVTSNVLLTAGGVPAPFGQTVGNDTSVGSSKKRKRQSTLAEYPLYNNTLAPTAPRTGFNIAPGDNGLIAFVGGDDEDPVLFFNQNDNGWIAATQILGTQTPTTSAVPTSTTASRSSTNIISTPSATSSSTAAASSSSDNNNNSGLTILGAVLGGICGMAAILIIILLWLRNIRKKRAQAEKQNDAYPDDKKRRSNDYNFEERGMPLAQAGQPMGRSPVASAVYSDRDSAAKVGLNPDQKLIRRISSEPMQKNVPNVAYRGSGIGFGQAMWKKEKSPLSISKPMDPNLGSYQQQQPSIELGMATPVREPVELAAPMSTAAAISSAAARAPPTRKESQRKTDEGWGKYFTPGALTGNRTTYSSRSSTDTAPAPPAGKTGALWPAPGAQESARSTKYNIRDSRGDLLNTQTVAAGSPFLENGPANPQSKGLQVVQPTAGRISSASSATTDSESDDDYEDERLDPAFSSGVPASIHESPWTPVGNTWSGPPQRPLRPPSHIIPSGNLPFPTTGSNETSNTGSSGTKRSSIPSFPMPSTTIRQVPPSDSYGSTLNAPAPVHYSRTPGRGPPSTDYFGHVRVPSDARDNTTDMSWLNLGTPDPNSKLSGGAAGGGAGGGR